jgi:hypothetical protein
MLGTWIIFDNDRFDLDRQYKTAGGFGSGMILKQLQKKGVLQDVNGTTLT